MTTTYKVMPTMRDAAPNNGSLVDKELRTVKNGQERRSLVLSEFTDERGVQYIILGGPDGEVGFSYVGPETRAAVVPENQRTKWPADMRAKWKASHDRQIAEMQAMVAEMKAETAAAIAKAEAAETKRKAEAEAEKAAFLSKFNYQERVKSELLRLIK